jgi:thiamine pyrophosphokinase
MFLIVSGGDPPGGELVSRKASRARYVIAADAGARVCLDCGVRPDLVVGDMDSIDEEALRSLDSSGVPFRVFDRDKDRTDTEIAVDAAIDLGARGMEILGALGDRIDHSLSNIHLLYKAMLRNAPAFIVTRTQLVFAVGSRAVLEGAMGLVASFLPLTQTVRGIVLEGFAYGLHGAVMETGSSYGVSNVVTMEGAAVSVGEGVLLGVLCVPEDRQGARVMTEAPDGAMVCAGR